VDRDAAEIRTKRCANRNRSPGCRAATATPDRRPLSTNLGSGRENRDLRQLLWHRHRLVQMRTRIMNQLHRAGVK